MKVRNLRRRVYRKKGGPPNIGLRCKDFEGGCIVCQCYRYFDENGGFPSFEQALERTRPYTHADALGGLGAP